MEYSKDKKGIEISNNVSNIIILENEFNNKLSSLVAVIKYK